MPRGELAPTTMAPSGIYGGNGRASCEVSEKTTPLPVFVRSLTMKIDPQNATLKGALLEHMGAE